MKYFFGVILILSFVFLGYLGYQKYNQARETVFALNQKLSHAENEVREMKGLQENLVVLEQQITNKEKEERIYTILAGGDIMMDRGVEGKIKKLGKDYDFAFDLIRNDLQQADFVFANLEGSISDIGTDTGKIYSFRFEPSVAKALSSAGIDLVSLANNHMLDWGRESLCKTTKHLMNVNVAYVGAGCDAGVAERPYMVTLGDTTVAFLAYTEFYQGAHAVGDKAGMSEYNLGKIIQRIAELKDDPEVDVVMVSMHWGEEYKPRANEYQVVTGKSFIDAGADVIIGHHPHVDQEIERYNDGWIIYSLGNFVFDQSWSEETMQGLLAEIQIQKGRVYDIVPKFIQLNENYQPELIN